MLTPWVTRIIFLNVAIYAAKVFMPGFERLTDGFMLTPCFIPFQPWTLITYMFLHANFGHVFFNMLSLFIFGPRLEGQLGGRRFMTLYLIAGIAGGLLSWPFSPYAHILGASGAILGVMFGFARFWPRERIMVWFAILEARYAVLLFVVLDLFGGFGGGTGVAHFAHLGGAAGAFVYLRITDLFSRATKLEAKLATPARPSQGDLTRWSRISREGLHPVNRDELDRIMTKIEQEGIGSLTPKERSFLETFSDRVGPSH